MAVPPVGTVYQRYCPATAPEALSTTVPVPQRVAPVPPGAPGIMLMVAITDVRILSHVPLLMATW
ncbi:MAG: hypothetical protein J0L67_06255 [Cytophagales bacterium]|nr:hypothetical protein [Cytophagales bacterium]